MVTETILAHSISDDANNVIEEIKKKVRNNPKYLHPCNKERLEDMKMLKFANGNEFTQWMQENRIMKGSTEFERARHKKTLENTGCKTTKEYQDKCAQKLGFKSHKDRQREKIKKWRHETGRNLPLEYNEECSAHFGEFTEKLMINRYPGAIKMPYGTNGFDYLWKDEKGKEIKVDHKGRCLTYHSIGNPICSFQIKYNDIADRFILSGWDNRESLNPLFLLEFEKNDLVRVGNGYNAPKVEFWKRGSFSVSYTSEELEEFREYWIDINWLKELLKENKETVHNLRP